MTKKIEVHLHEGYSNCGDGCCDDWYTDLTVNGETVSINGSDDLVEIVLADMFGLYILDFETPEEYYEALFKAIDIEATFKITDSVSQDMDSQNAYFEMMDNEDDNEGDDY